MRKTYSWKLPRIELELGPRTLVMGILNLTPDSFSDGGLFTDPQRAATRALAIQAEGAEILDIGGQSTRPGSTPISEDEEWLRVLPVLKRIATSITIPISIDTYYASVAYRAIDYGAQIINDISGFRLDPAMKSVARKTGAGVVLMHSRGPRADLFVRPENDSPEAVRDELGETIQAAVDAGITPERIVADPGIGFSKTREVSLKILKRLDLFSTLGYPLLVGMSRKSFIRMDIPVQEAEVWATAAAATQSITAGAHIIRVHDVGRMRVVAEIADMVERA
jgi:dihydropteroate synthase